MISLRKRFTLWSLGATAILAAVAGLSLYFFVRTALYREFDAGLRTRAQLIGSLLRIEDNGKYGMDFSDESMPEYLPGRRPEYFQVIAPDGTTLERSQSLKASNLLAPSAPQTPADPWNLILLNGRPGRAIAILAQPHTDADDHDRPDPHQPAKEIRQVPALVIVAQDRSQIDRALEPLLSALMVAGLILAIGSIIAVRFVVWQALKPINELAQCAQDVGPTNLDYRFDIARLPAELQLICQRLNELLERLDQAFRRERRLNADVAHELRTPIAELRSLTEVARRWPIDADESAIYFRDAHSIALKMGSVVETLLTLARARANIIKSPMETIALNGIVEQSFATQQDEIARRGLSAALVLPADYLITTNSQMFARLIDNIVSNAVDYVPEHGRIECKAECTDALCTLTIGNSNNSLTPDDLREIFDAFWRKDAARADSEHTGLGLALVTEYAKQLGIVISAHLPSPTWFEITLKIPRGTHADSKRGTSDNSVATMALSQT